MACHHFFLYKICQKNPPCERYSYRSMGMRPNRHLSSHNALLCKGMCTRCFGVECTRIPCPIPHLLLLFLAPIPWNENSTDQYWCRRIFQRGFQKPQRGSQRMVMSILDEETVLILPRPRSFVMTRLPCVCTYPSQETSRILNLALGVNREEKECKSKRVKEKKCKSQRFTKWRNILGSIVIQVRVHRTTGALIQTLTCSRTTGVWNQPDPKLYLGSSELFFNSCVPL